VRAAVLTSAVIAALLAACGGDGESSSAAPVTTQPATTTAATEPAATSIQPPELEDGRHFGYLQAARVTAEPREVVFDLAQFLTGEEANAAAEERDFESPVPNDYFVVDDNPRLRTVPISPKLTIDLVDWKRCCDKRFAADPARFEASFTTEPPPGGRYRGRLSAYWLTVAGGVVTAIEEQYLP
jgi:hypothetical protein